MATRRLIGVSPLKTLSDLAHSLVPEQQRDLRKDSDILSGNWSFKGQKSFA